MTDLIQRLRAIAAALLTGEEPTVGQIVEALGEAADELERQRQALRWYMDVMHFHMGCGPDCEAHHGDALEEIT